MRGLIGVVIIQRLALICSTMAKADYHGSPLLCLIHHKFECLVRLTVPIVGLHNSRLQKKRQSLFSAKAPVSP